MSGKNRISSADASKVSSLAFFSLPKQALTQNHTVTCGTKEMQ
ncbi:MAG: hypothetical protein ACK40V_02235 [Anaerolineales bacterium]